MPLERTKSNLLGVTSVPHIPVEQLTWGDQISSEGSSGIVHKGVWNKGDGSAPLDVAIKTVKCAGEEGTLAYASSVKLFEQEVAVFKSGAATHGLVCQIYGVSEKDNGLTLCTVMKLYGPSVADIIRSSGHQSFDLERIHRYSVDCLEGLAALHSNGIIMQDFKPANVLLDEEDHAVVADFDMAANVGHIGGIATMTNSTGTPAYQSPEAWEPNDFGGVTVKTDMWGFACFVIEMATGREPWHGMRWPSIRRAILQNCQTPEIPAVLPEHIRKILTQCFQMCPENRPHAKEVLAEFKRVPWGAPDTSSKENEPPKAVTKNMANLSLESHSIQVS